MQVSNLLVGFLAVWLFILTVFVIWIFNFFRRLTTNIDKDNLVEVLRKVLTKEEENSLSIKSLQKQLDRLFEEETLHIQKLGLVRFNPFQELGGDHSFSLTLLDGKDSGVILTGLHARERTRVYIKKIKMGKSELELSKDEKRALEIAQKNKLDKFVTFKK